MLFAGAREVNPEALDAYLQGQLHYQGLSVKGLEQAIQYFDQAIAIDPSYALAYVGRAKSYRALPYVIRIAPKEVSPKARAAAMKAIELDETLSEAFMPLAWTLAAYDWDWSGAEKAYKRGLDIQPRSPYIHLWYGWFLSWMGRHEEAIAEIQRGRELDPYSTDPIVQLSAALTMARRYDEAIEEARKAVERRPNSNLAHHFYAMALKGKGMYQEAIDERRKSLTLSGGSQLWKAFLGHTYAVAGRRNEALKILDELKEPSEQGYIASELIAKVYAGLGEKEEAFRWLEKALVSRALGSPSGRSPLPGPASPHELSGVDVGQSKVVNRDTK